jgi:6-phosphogluconolactonase
VPTIDPEERTEEHRPGAATDGDAPPSDTATAPPWLPSPPQIHRYLGPAEVAAAAAKRFVETAKRAVDQTDRFVVVVSGGSTPRPLYRLLTESPYRESVDWGKTFFVFADERAVPPDHEDSNYRTLREALFDPLAIPAHNVLRMKGEQNPVEAARRYEVRIGDLFLSQPRRNFDLAVLGVGADGHTASLFPGTSALDEQERWVVANEVPQLGAWRITLTFPALDAARRVLFLATGEEKAPVIAEAFGGAEHAEAHPCERVLPRGRRDVLIDHAAAALLAAHTTQDSAGD